MSDSQEFIRKLMTDKVHFSANVDNDRSRRENLGTNFLPASVSKHLKTSTIAIDLTKTKGLVVVDIDVPEVWDGVLRAYNAGELGKAIVNPTSRGGHLIYRCELETRAKVRTNRINVACRLGIRLDFLLNGTVDIMGPGRTQGTRKYVANMDLFTGISELSTIPEEFSPLPRKFTPIIVDKLLTEPGRNSVIHSWCVKKHSLSTSATLLGKYFCNPPLPDSELTMLARSRERFEDVIKTEKGFPEDFAFIEESFKDKIAYDLQSGWVKQDSGGWAPTNIEEITYLLGTFIHENKHNLTDPPKTILEASYVENVAKVLRYCLVVSDLKSDIPVGLNFKNGYLILKSKQLIPHDPHLYIRKPINSNYVANAYPDSEIREILAQLCNFDAGTLQKIRTLGYRALVPSEDLQSFYVLHGPPGTGKSTWVNFLFKLLGGSATASVKNIQGNSEFTFNGVVIVVTNSQPADLFGDNPALLDRAILIPFHHKPEVYDGKLQQKLMDKAGQVVNWFATIPEVDLHPLIRVGRFNNDLTIESNPIASWMSEKLYFNSTVSTPKDEIYDDFKALNLYTGKVVRKPEFTREVMNYSNQCFGFKITQSRGRVLSEKGVVQVACLDNITLLPEIQGIPNRSLSEMSVKNQYLSDPWAGVEFQDGDSDVVRCSREQYKSHKKKKRVISSKYTVLNGGHRP